VGPRQVSFLIVRARIWGVRFALIQAALRQRLPQAAGERITHHWSGQVGIPDWTASVGLDRRTGLAPGRRLRRRRRGRQLAAAPWQTWSQATTST
jgi:hypothetical protein